MPFLLEKIWCEVKTLMKTEIVQSGKKDFGQYKSRVRGDCKITRL